VMWPLVQINSCARIVGGSTPDTNRAEYWGGEIPWATPKDLSELEGATISATPRTITTAGLASCSSEVLPENSVLFSSRAPIGHVAINMVPMATNQGFKSFVPNPEQLDAKFLYHWLRANKTYLQSLGNGATFKEVSKEVVSRVKIPLPPMKEQLRIAAILDQAEALRLRRRQALAKVDTLTQSLFLEMFGDPVTNPKAWRIHRLEELCREVTDIDHKMPRSVEEGVPFISAKDLLDDGTLSFENVKKISPEDFDRLARKSRPRRGDIIYSRIGANLGKARLVEVDFDFLASYSCCTIKPKPELIDPVFLCSFLDSPFALRQARKGIRAIAVPDLGLNEIKNFRIPVPPMAVQVAFRRRVESLAALRVSYRISNVSLTALSGSLQYRAFRGEL
jgi:type I restriction enzyme, S subunit